MKEFQKDLINWYAQNHRPLEFRLKKDPYEIWISEIMAQQTRIEAMLPYYKRWIKELPNIHSVANCDDEKLTKLWQGLGYYSRCKNIKKCAVECVEKYSGKLPYTKEELLIEDFLIEKENNIEIYYAPHNEYFNQKAKIFIVGITPGFQQMSTAISTARKELEFTDDINEVQYRCKVAARFSGSLRKNIINMLNDIKLNEALHIESVSEIFEEKDYLLHTVSLIPYPVFVKKENYTGHTPKLIKSEFLMKYIYENFVDEFKKIENYKEVLLIPLGRAVEEVLLKLKDDGIIGENQILIGFPHPSGANVNRVKQLEENKENMISFIKNKF